MTTIEIARDFSPVPLGRLKADGRFSGEALRELLLRALRHSTAKVCVILDGTEGYGCAFLEEAFGGLVREGHYTPQELADRLEVVAKSRPYRIYADEIWDFIKAAGVAAPEGGDSRGKAHRQTL
jgi:hypothetical protein